MPNGEVRIIGQNRRILNCLTLALVVGLGLMIRKELIWYVSRDWTGSMKYHKKVLAHWREIFMIMHLLICIFLLLRRSSEAKAWLP